MAADRIRVFIAGNIYVTRALVRRFLEDDGFEVTGEARTREDMMIAVRRDQPDAVVIDDELLIDGPGGGTIGRLRRGAPDAKVVVFTSSPIDPATAPNDADGYLEKGVGLASLTALLGRLFAEPIAPARVPMNVDAATLGDDEIDDVDGALVGAGREVTSSAATGPSRGDGSTRGAWTAGISRIAAMAAGAVLIVGGLGAMIVSGGDDAPTRTLDRTDTTGGTVSEPEPGAGETTLDRAYATLDELVSAIENGNHVLATVSAQTLMDLREQATAAGFALTGLDAEIAARLESLVVDIPVRVSDALAQILGPLYPRVSPDPDEPGGGSDVVLRTTVTDDDDETSPQPRDTARSGGPDGDRPDGDGPGGGGPDGDGPDGGGVEPQPEPPVLGPGDGRAWGLSHHPHGGPPGHNPDHPHGPPTSAQQADRDGGKPPWAGP
jgi:ActR/RegA family two-component response regulator